jgi:hypothetical protein
LITSFTGFHFIKNHKYHSKQHRLLGVDTDGTFSEKYYLARDKARYHAKKEVKCLMLQLMPSEKEMGFGKFTF